MVTGKAKTRKTFGTKLKDQTKNTKYLYGVVGSSKSPTASMMSFSYSGGASSPPAIDEYKRLKTAGGTMIGAIAFYPKAALIDSNGAIDLLPSGSGDLTDDYTSYLMVTGNGNNDDDLVTINNAQHSGQLLHIEAIVTTDITLKHNTGNIFIPSESDHIISAGGFATLIFDPAIHANKWVLMSSSDGSGGGSSLLSSNNTWTGNNTFSGGTFASAATTSTSITSPAIFLGDQSTDAITITGSITSSATNVWSGINTFSANVSMTGSTVAIGDAATDVLAIYGKMGSDINMSTYDVYNIDRLKFSQTAGSGDTLTTSDTGIEAIYASGNPYGMKIQIPTANSAIFQLMRGSTDMLNISAAGIVAGDSLSMSTNKITNVGEPTSNQDAATKYYVDNNGGGGGWNGNATGDLDMNGNDIDMDGGDIDMDNGDIIDANLITGATTISGTNGVFASLSSSGTASFNSTMNLGDSSGDDINLKGKLDVRNNHSTITLGFAPLPTGYITINISGSSKRLYYYDG